MDATSALPGQDPRRFGVEEELLLVDAESFLPAPVAVAALAAARDLPEGVSLAHEVKTEQIEAISPPLRDHRALLDAIRAGRRGSDAAAQTVGARTVALATAPVLSETHLTPTTRYERMAVRFGLTMRQQLTCGLHIHVEIASPEEGVAVLDRIRSWLPVVLALSANSPYGEGEDSGYASFRYQIWGRWPGSGIQEPFRTLERYTETVRLMKLTGVAIDDGMVYFDARLSSHVPTVEIRIADVCLDAEHAAALACLVRALVATAARAWADGGPIDDTPAAALRLAAWHASRFGAVGRLVHPVSRGLEPAGTVVDALLAHVASGFADADEETFVQAQVAAILADGTGAAAQRAVRAVGSWQDVVRHAVDRTHAP